MRIIRDEKPNVFDYCCCVQDHIKNMTQCPLEPDESYLYCSNRCEYYTEKGED